MSSSGKFELNRSRFRKVYAYGAKPVPAPVAFFDAFLQVSSSFDFNEVIRDRDMYFLQGPNGYGTPLANRAYYENIVALSPFGLSDFNITFTSSPFTTAPIVTAQVLGDNVNAYVYNITSAGFTLGLSAPITSSATVSFKAIAGASVFPCLVERTPLSPGTFATVSAGTVTLTAASSSALPFADLTTVPTDFTTSPIEAGLFQGDTFVSQSSLVSNSATVELSQLYTGDIDYIALKT